MSCPADRAALLASADLLPVVNALDNADQAQLKAAAAVIGFLLGAVALLSIEWVTYHRRITV